MDLKIVSPQLAPKLAPRVVEAKEYHAVVSAAETSWQKETTLKLDAIMHALGVRLNDKEKGSSNES